MFAQFALARTVQAASLRPRYDGGIPAGVRADDAQPREFVERAVEDQSREEVGRLERVADDVAEIGAAAERALLQDVVGTAGMHDDRHTELRRFRPEGVVLRQRQILSVDVATDRCAAQPEALDAVFELLRRELWMLQRD